MNGGETDNGQQISNVAAGEYTVVATHTSSNCSTLPKLITIKDVAEYPISVIIEEVSASHCDLPNGSLRAYAVHDDFPDRELAENDKYSFEWFLGNDAVGTPLQENVNNGNNGSNVTFPLGENNFSTISGLAAPLGNATYTVKVTFDDTKCFNTSSKVLGSNIELPEISLVSSTNDNGCNLASASGQASIDLSYQGSSISNLSDYELLIYDDTDTSSLYTNAELNNVTGKFSKLEGDEYYAIVAYSKETKCRSNVLSVEIGKSPIKPSIDFDNNNNTLNSICSITTDIPSYNGVITASIDGNEDPSNYEYEWYLGQSNTNTVLSEIAGSIKNNQSNYIELNNVPGGIYTLEVKKLATECISTAEYSLSDNFTIPGSNTIPTFNKTSNSHCEGGIKYPNGAISLDQIDGNSASNYSFQWYVGNSVNIDSLINDGTDLLSLKGKGNSRENVSLSPTGTVTNLDAGNYSVVIGDARTNCLSSPYIVNLENNFVDIIITEISNTSNTHCSVPNGEYEVSATMAESPFPSNFSFKWFSGSDLSVAELRSNSNVASINDIATNNISGLNNGLYSVQVTNDETNCSSSSQFYIQNETNQPVIDKSIAGFINHRTNCENPSNGTIDPAVTGVLTPISDYTLKLFHSSDDIQTASPLNEKRNAQFENVQEGNYLLVAIDSLNCQSEAASIELKQTPTIQDFTLSATDNTNCDSSNPNGTITINLTSSNPTSGYTIFIYSGSNDLGEGNETEKLTTTTSSVSSTVGMNAGQYTVTVLNNTSQCSTSKKINLGETLDYPTVTSTVSTDVKFCNADNGSITINSSNHGSSPIYSIYTGTTITSASDSTSTDNKFENLPTGTYVVRVIKSETGCEIASEIQNVNEDFQTFSFTANVVQQQISCDYDSPLGQIEAHINNSTSGYEFEWYQGQGTGSQITSNTSIEASKASVNNLSEGVYTLKVIEIESGCIQLEEFNIINSEVDPTLSIGTIVGNSSCSSLNGEIEVSSGISNLNYSFELYLSANTGINDSPISTSSNGLSTYTFDGLNDGDYRIKIIDDNTSCTAFSTSQNIGYVGDEISIDESGIAVGNISTCFSDDGTLDVSNALIGLDSDVSIQWFIGNDTSNIGQLLTNKVPTSIQNDIIDGQGTGYTIFNGRLSKLPAVHYSGIITLDNGCKRLITSNLNQTGAAELTLSNPITSKSCVAPFDGEFEITIDPQGIDNASEFNYYIFKEEIEIAPDADESSPYDPNLASYDNGDNLVAFGTFPNNGNDNPASITIDKLSSDLQGNFVSKGIAPGIYTVGIEVKTDQCIQAVKTINIEKPAQIVTNISTSQNNSVCTSTISSSYNGSITAEATHPSRSDIFDFQWYYESSGTYSSITDSNNGAGTGTNPVGSTADDVSNSQINDLGKGNFQVIITHDETKCSDTLNYELFDDPVVITIGDDDTQDFSLDHIQYCGDAGSFKLLRVFEDGNINTDVANEYAISWEKISDTPPTNVTPNVSEVEADDLSLGTYRVTLTNDGGLSSNCSNSFEFTIEDNSINPILAIDGSVTSNSNCTGASSSTGEVIIKVIDNDGNTKNLSDYNINWYTNSACTIPLTTTGNTNNERAFELASGTYYVVAEGKNSNSQNCTDTLDITIIDELPTLSIDIATDLSISHQNNCDPIDSEIIINQIQRNGVIDANISDYSFVWTNNTDGTDPIKATSNIYDIGGSNHTGTSLSQIPEGKYFVQAINSTSQCTTEFIELEIEDRSSNPIVELTQIQADENCSTSPTDAGTGELKAEIIVNGSVISNVADYSFQWYVGTTVATVQEVGSIIVPAPTDNNQSISGIPDATYTVVVTDNNNSNVGCSSQSSISLEQFTPTYYIGSDDATDYTLTNNNNCISENGAININQLKYVDVDGNTQTKTLPDADYTLSWYDSYSGGNVLGNGNNLSGLSEGVIFLEISDQKQCSNSSNRQSFMIQNTFELPVIQFEIEKEDSNCGTAASFGGSGSIRANVLDQNGDIIANVSDYSFDWFESDGDPVGTDFSGVTTTGTNNQVVNGLAEGNYNVVVSKTANPYNGCESSANINLEEELPLISITQDDYDIVNNTSCFDLPAVTGNGSITINQIRENNIVVNGDYDFDWTNLPTEAVSSSSGTFNDNIVTNLIPGVYSVNVTNTTSDCSTNQEIQIVVGQEAILPKIELTLNNDNSICNNTIGIPFNGSVSATSTYNGNVNSNQDNYTFEWSSYGGNPYPEGNVVNGTGTNDNSSTFEELEAGLYEVKVTYNNNCSSTASINVSNNTFNPAFSIPESQITTLTNCNAASNGAIEIRNEDIDGNLNDYEFELFLDVNNIASSQGARTSSPLFSNLDAGIYSIVATNMNTACHTPEVVAIVYDESELPIITIDSIVSNTGCTNGLNDGAVYVYEEDINDTYSWYQGSQTLSSSISSTQNLINVTDNTYSLKVTNSITSCSSTIELTIPREAAEPRASLSSIAQTDCLGNAEASVTGIEFAGTVASLNDFNFTWYDNKGNLILPSTSGASGGYSINNSNTLTNSVKADTFRVVTEHIASGCLNAEIIEIEIDEDITYPSITIIENAQDLSCEGGTGTGILSAVVDGANASDPNYNYEWTDNESNPITSDADGTISELTSGLYNLKVSNTSTGCESEAVYDLQEGTLTYSVSSSSVTASNYCNPYNGSIEIQSMTTGTLSDFIFTFYSENEYPEGTPIPGESATQTALSPGIYYVEIVHRLTNCIESEPLVVQFTVEDETEYPEITLNQISLQNNCNDQPNGWISVLANSSTEGHSFQWSKGQSPSNDTRGREAKSTENLEAGFYTVIATNTTTGCSSTKSFEMIDDVQNPIELTLSSSSNLNCSSPFTGKVAARVKKPNKPLDNYNFQWSDGTSTSMPNMAQLTELVHGEYTIKVVDEEGGCESLEQTIVIEDGTNLETMDFELIEEASVTHCAGDGYSDNGIASAQPNSGDFSQYHFDWYDGTSPASDFLDRGIKVDSLKAQAYYVEMIDRYTRCIISKNIEIHDSTKRPSKPTITSINNTECIHPNGSASVELEGQTNDYSFHWNNGAVANSIYNLGQLDDTETYSVYARDITTNCISDLEYVTIYDESTIPEFTVSTINANCALNNGEANILFESPLTTGLKTVTWTSMGEKISSSEKLAGVPGGNDYTVQLTDDNNCSYGPVKFRIDTDLVVYNGISDNSDGKNDFLRIACADDYPNNSLQIFSSSGVLVYETEGYLDYDENYGGVELINVFTGKSNNGKSIPTGTYYYSFDKGVIGQGQNVYKGYIEIVR